MFLLLLSVLGAEAATTCSVTLVQGGVSTEVSGYGDTEPEASRDARSWANRLAAHDAAMIGHLLLDRPGLAAGASGWGPGAWVPGSTVTAGDCVAWSPPRGEAFEATLGRERVLRSDPVVAMRAVRRRACLRISGTTMAKDLDGLAVVSQEERQLVVHRMFSSVRDDLAACLSRQPTVAKSSEKVERALGVYRCVDPGPLHADALGTSLERAREEALSTYADLQIHTGLAEAHEAYGSAAPETRMLLVTRGLTRFTRVLGFSDAHEQAVKPELAERLAAAGFGHVMACRASCRREATTSLEGARVLGPTDLASLRALVQSADLDAFLAMFPSVHDEFLRRAWQTGDLDALRGVFSPDTLPVEMVEGRAYFHVDQ